MLTLVAFGDLKRLGLDAFAGLSDGKGWMPPGTLRLAHDDRAKEPQPVAERIQVLLGPAHGTASSPQGNEPRDRFSRGLFTHGILVWGEWDCARRRGVRIVKVAK